jgi:hypothetical protein
MPEKVLNETVIYNCLARFIMRLIVSSIFYILLVIPCLAVKKRKVPKEELEIKSLLSRSTTVVSELLSVHTELRTGFKSFCDTFGNFPREVKPEEEAAFTVVSDFSNFIFFKVQPTLESHAVSLEQEFASLSGDATISLLDKLDRMNQFLKMTFKTVVETHESLERIFSQFRTKSKDYIDTNRKPPTIFGMKVRQLGELLHTERSKWPTMAETMRVLVADIESHTLSFQTTSTTADASDDTTSTTTTEVSSAAVDATTQEPDYLFDEPLSVDPEALAFAANEALRAAIEVRNTMDKFLTSYSSMRKSIGRDAELNQRLDEMLAFPSVRAIAWDNFVKEFATFTRDLSDKP